MTNSREDIDMEEVPNADTNPPRDKTPAQVAQEVRHGPATPEQGEQFPAGPRRASQDSNTPGATAGKATNEQMRNIVEKGKAGYRAIINYNNKEGWKLYMIISNKQAGAELGKAQYKIG